MPRLADPDPDLPLIVTSSAALAAGLSPDQIRHRVRSGRWDALAKGVYRRTSASPQPADTLAQRRLDHAQLAAAQALALDGTVIAGLSAAWVLGLPTIATRADRVTLVRPGAHSTRRKHCSVLGWQLGSEDVLRTVPPVTTVARTWLDVARTMALADALAVGDHALRCGLTDLVALREQVERAHQLPGHRQTRVALGHVDGLRESPLESASWAYFLQHRIPLPQMQVVITAGSGRFLGRVDFLWPHCRLIGECDGQVKYEGREALYAEKLREDEMRAEGYQFARWGQRHLASDVLAHRLLRIIA